uniref:Uncharacterized protein n=1 Tax=Arion vulgaris TaxID=1028688 RepID=A0A0B7BAZ4_9EUPU
MQPFVSLLIYSIIPPTYFQNLPTILPTSVYHSANICLPFYQHLPTILPT